MGVRTSASYKVEDWNNFLTENWDSQGNGGVEFLRHLTAKADDNRKTCLIMYELWKKGKISLLRI